MYDTKHAKSSFREQICVFSEKTNKNEIIYLKNIYKKKSPDSKMLRLISNLACTDITQLDYKWSC